jgi:hypothetical protein
MNKINKNDIKVRTADYITYIIIDTFYDLVIR